MRTLHASTPVKAPARFAIAFLQNFVRDHHSRTVEGPRLNLRVPLTRFAGGVVLERPVTVNLSYLPQDDLERPGLAIQWEPADTKLFPRFTGTIQAEAAGERTARLRARRQQTQHAIQTCCPLGRDGLRHGDRAGRALSGHTILRYWKAAMAASRGLIPRPDLRSSELKSFSDQVNLGARPRKSKEI